MIVMMIEVKIGTCSTTPTYSFLFFAYTNLRFNIFLFPCCPRANALLLKINTPAISIFISPHQVPTVSMPTSSSAPPSSVSIPDQIFCNYVILQAELNAHPESRPCSRFGARFGSQSPAGYPASCSTWLWSW